RRRRRAGRPLGNMEADHMTNEHAPATSRARQIAAGGLTAGVTIVGGSLAIGGQPVAAAGIEVTDPGDNPAVEGTLAWAIDRANNQFGPDVITFEAGLSGTIDLHLAPV